MGALLGLAAGDAVGAAIEFSPKPHNAVLDDMAQSGPHPLQRGQWTDGTVMALALADCRPCLDWSERRPHVVGAVGAALCDCCFTLGWVRRIEGTRAITVTPKGRRGIKQSFGVEAG